MFQLKFHRQLFIMQCCILLWNDIRLSVFIAKVILDL